MQIISANNKISEPTCATIGVFDGVHLGHRFLLENLQKTAISSQLKSLVVTFRNHPQEFFNYQNNFKLLTTENEKIDLIAKHKPDFTLLLDFNKEISAMKAADFLLFLKNNYSLKKLVVGYNHSFGSDKIGDFERYKEIGKNLNIEIVQCEPYFFCNNLSFRPKGEIACCQQKTTYKQNAIYSFSVVSNSPFGRNDSVVSSSNIRNLLLDGNIETANTMLGKNYSLSGIVQNGEKNGRKIGFPTANLAISSQKLIPKVGVYSVDVLYKNNIFKGMLYIGNRPTLDGKKQSVEVNIFDFNENIYGESITIFLKKFIREDKKFNSLEELKDQLIKDKEKICCYFDRRRYLLF